ncbi:MAG: nucleoside-diphosphate kinase [Candidatus Diapherotrites archaeon CG10_big_fil_rev_8_21_14_0_10_31_34]|nr:MAG: nucleoside-diphosphate kinase [Candidatus Diapherotrites archaeon CG10_big_fil_rev_8_21_14_0_10_31_34]
MERTLILVKHDGVQRGLIGEIIKRFEQKGLKIAGMKMVQATKETADKHYVITPEWTKKLGENARKLAEKKGITVKETDEEIAKRIHSQNSEYLTEGPIVAITFEGYHAIEIGRKLIGNTEARKADLGTIRGDFTVDSYDLADEKQRSVRNLIHASEDLEQAAREVNLWFDKKELHAYTKKEWEVMHK